MSDLFLVSTVPLDFNEILDVEMVQDEDYGACAVKRAEGSPLGSSCSYVGDPSTKLVLSEVEGLGMTRLDFLSYTKPLTTMSIQLVYRKLEIEI